MGRGPTKEYHRDMMQGFVKGTLTCLSGDFIKNNINTDFPLILNIEPTNACNLSCYFCPRSMGRRPVGYMDFESYKKIINECKSYKRLKMLNFHKDGESLLHPKLFEMIRYADKTDAADCIHLNTNGTLLSGESARKLLLSGIDDITVSIDAAREETYKKLKKKDCLKELEYKVEGMLELKNKLGLKKPFIRVKIMEFDEISKSEIKEFAERWQGVADDVQVTGVHNWSQAIDGLNVTDETREVRYPCVLLWYMMAINWDGQVSACNVDWNLSALIGDIRESTIHEIWTGNKIKKLRKSELSGEHTGAQVCEKCVVWAGGEDLTDWLKEKKEFYIL